MFMFLALFVLALPQVDSTPTTHEFSDLISSLFAEIEGISLIVEGEQTSLDDGAKRADRPKHLFQTHYVFRLSNPSAGLLETYEWITPNPPSHRSIAVLNGFLDESDRPVRQTPLDPKTKKPLRPPGAAFSLCGSLSPQSFIYYWYFPILARLGGKIRGYESLGWEEINGHRCLKVKLGVVPGGGILTSHNLFWLDVGRGGHPLRIENYYKDHLIYRVDSIELSQITTQNGKMVWLPVKGEVKVFGSIEGPYHQKPTNHEVYRVVLGSVQINPDLPDSVFVIHTKPRRELGNAIALRTQNPVEAKPPKVGRPKTDPASVQARLNAKMAEADRQAKEIEASSPARTSWGAVGVTQIVFAVIGVGLIGTAGFWMWRRS